MLEKIMDKMLRMGTIIGSQKHMIAIRDGFAYNMPLIMAGGLTVMFSSVFTDSDGLLASFFANSATLTSFFAWTGEHISPWLWMFFDGTLAITSLALVLGISYARAQQEKVDVITTALTSLGCFFLLSPMVGNVVDGAAKITTYFDAKGILVALITGLIASEITIRITQKGWIIKMPEMVPPAVGQGFAAIIPCTITLGVFAFIPYLFSTGLINLITDDGTQVVNIFQLIETTIIATFGEMFGATNPDNLVSSGIAITFVSLFQNIFWFFGLHGGNLSQPFIAPIWGMYGQLNVQEYMQSGTVLYPWTSGSWDIYVHHGGTGATMGLLIAIKLFNRRPDTKEVAKIALASGIFEINEPVIFGIPIVLNPIYAIPFILVSPLLTIVAYISTVVIGFGQAPVLIAPWTTPPILFAYLSTAGDIPSTILAAFTLFLSVLIYAPFVILSNKQFEREEVNKC